MTDDALRQETQARGLPIDNMAALRQALTHKSLVPNAPLTSNERLEFLGDAVLGLVVAEHLLNTLPDCPEGQLAKARALVVCKDALAAAAERLNLAPLLQIGTAEEAMGGRSRASLVADAMEALFAVIYTESGYARAREFILTTLAPVLAEVAQSADWRDPKSVLQEQRQAAKQSVPVYVVTRETGRPHDRTYYIDVLLDGAVAGSGTGKTKKQAQQTAASVALAAGGETHGA